MSLWARILDVPGMGGALVMILICLWLAFLIGMIAWIAKAPREVRQ